MDRIDVVSNAMELRGFGKHKKRTWYMGKAVGGGRLCGADCDGGIFRGGTDDYLQQRKPFYKSVCVIKMEESGFKNTMEQMEALKQSIREKEDGFVAFSGGVDSTFLLKVAHDVLGRWGGRSDGLAPVPFRRELREAKAFCEKGSIKHIVVESEELQIEGFFP